MNSYGLTFKWNNQINCGNVHHRPILVKQVFTIPTRVLHGPGRPAAHGPAGAGSNDICRVGCGPETCRAGPGMVNYNFVGCGPGLGLTFPGLGRARAYTESHSCFNIMVKYYRQLSITKRSVFPMM